VIDDDLQSRPEGRLQNRFYGRPSDVTVKCGDLDCTMHASSHVGAFFAAVVLNQDAKLGQMCTFRQDDVESVVPTLRLIDACNFGPAHKKRLLDSLE